MCGICGIVAFDGGGREWRARRAAAMLEALGHRGPDGSRLRDGASWSFGAARLAIRGPRGGRQPLVGHGGWAVVCNGEIDNERELRGLLSARGWTIEGESDVDLLPALFDEFGADGVERIEGPFALAAWNESERRLILARDSAGERPLFVACRAGEVAFASELAALAVASPSTPVADPRAIGHYLSRGRFDAPRTPLAGFEKLAPGELWIADARGARRRRFRRWLPGGIAPAAPDATGLERALGAALEAAVVRQCAVDVPYGIFLSGGLDSSLLAAIATRASGRPPKAAFCVRFSDSSYDEGARARRVARRFGLPLGEVTLGAETAAAMLGRLVARAGEPLADPAWAPTALLAGEAARSVRMVLSGEGADELFGGYPTYLGLEAARRFATLPAAIRGALAAAGRRLPWSERKMTISFLVRRFVEGADLAPLARHRFWNACVDDRLLAELGLEPPAGEEPEEPEGIDALGAVQRIDFEQQLAEGLMTKSDRAAMAVGLEVRCPYLDLGVVRVAADLPPNERVQGLRTKILLRRVARRRLPGWVVAARKRGLSVPLAGWLRGPLRSWVRERLANPRLESLGVETGRACALVDAHCAGGADFARAIWALAALSEWADWLAALERRRVTLAAFGADSAGACAERRELTAAHADGG